jgi:anion-transporting  ArsA/GET3 family ATPase
MEVKIMTKQMTQHEETATFDELNAIKERIEQLTELITDDDQGLLDEPLSIVESLHIIEEQLFEIENFLMANQTQYALAKVKEVRLYTTFLKLDENYKAMESN